MSPERLFDFQRPALLRGGWRDPRWVADLFRTHGAEPRELEGGFAIVARKGERSISVRFVGERLVLQRLGANAPPEREVNPGQELDAFLAAELWLDGWD